MTRPPWTISSDLSIASLLVGTVSVLGEPDILELLVRVVIGRRDVVLHLRPVHDASRPPDAWDVVRVAEHDPLDLVDRFLALGSIERSRLTREQIVDPRIGEAAPVVAVALGVPLEELVGIVHEVERRRDDQLEAAGVASVREPRRGFERPVLDFDADLAPLLDHERAEVDVRDADVPVLQDDLEAVRVPGFNQEALRLRAVLLRVLPEPRKLLELALRHRPLRAGPHQSADVLEARDRVQDTAHRVPVETER